MLKNSSVEYFIFYFQNCMLNNSMFQNILKNSQFFFLNIYLFIYLFRKFQHFWN